MNTHNYLNQKTAISNKTGLPWTPSLLHAACWFYGFESSLIKYSRILVLGCDEEETLLAIATSCPFARVVGVNLITEVQDERQKPSNAYIPENLEFYYLSIEEILNLQDNCWDYIVLQNPFSLLNQEVTSALLQHLSGLLSDNGVIAFHWTCLPGSAHLDKLRDALQIYSGEASSSDLQLARAKLMLMSLSVTSDSLGIRLEQAKSEKISDVLFSHHYLETSNEGEYLIEFNARINSAGLCYIGDLDAASELSESYGHQVADLHNTFDENRQKILHQQYLDLLTNRMGRFSLLTHKKHIDMISILPELSNLKNMRFAGSFRRILNNTHNVSTVLAGNDGIKVSTADETTLQILDILGDAWPRSLSFEQLVFHCELIGYKDIKDTAAVVEESLRALFLKRLPGLHYTKEKDEYSTANNVEVHVLQSVHCQLDINPDLEWIINGWGERVEINELERKQLKNNLIVNTESWTVLYSLHCKGLLNAGGIGWKHFLQDMIRNCPQESIFNLASSLFLYSCDESAFGFMDRKQKMADKTKSVIKFVDEDVELTEEQKNTIYKLTLHGEYRKAYEIACEYLDGSINTGATEYYLYTLARRIGDYDIALIKLSRALSYHSTSVFLYSELAFAFLSCKYHWQAWRFANAILRCNKKSSPEWYLLASIHYDFKRFEDSEYCAREAYKLVPESKLIVTLLGGTLCEQAKTDEGIEFIRKGIKNKETDYSLMSGLAFILSHSAKTSVKDILDIHYEYGRGVKKWAQKQRFSGFIVKNKDPERRLRIGFVSGDFRDRHPVSFFFSPIWHSLDHSNLELYAYSNIPAHHENEGTERFKATADHWRNVRHMSDREMAEMIKLDEIDILVDLSGYTSDNRLPVFALKPAPIQISWIGYHATTGLDVIDYYATIFPVKKSLELEKQFTEKLIYMFLPKIFDQMANENNTEVNSLPALYNGHVTFGSFNRANKLNEQVFDAWTSVLKLVPNSRMIIGNMPKVVWENVKQQFTSRGVDVDRFELREMVDMDTYLAYHHDIDLLLDTFPFTGGTVTSHAAWMGVPTVSFAGETLVSRQGAAIMYSVNLPQFVADNIDDYINIAVQWAEKKYELNQIRQELRSRMSIKVDTQQQIGALVEKMFRTCWKRYCEGKKAESFSIGDAPDF
ncbi:TPA: hypothetical protein I8271_003236 [Kluyvera intermedia]|uniref:O-GlcNAc transferase C-terminal domain-containing protein n=2 Tax=Enterobacteriaceae TaxID=543 RepID=A0AAC8TLH8_9ENTR|nr:methyltransferase regulatory domain-containing protein [Phytobacter ursingii]HAT2204813.1 hypothetical protein [Kluyvera intermedia]AKL11450.1 hypothetical protein AB182_09085 [Phytobacter ursingii]HAT2515374.1 hypothetical protein [Kluyvera intermedia]HAT2606094.1 hypothetical protein [Kluyvera intermedia]HAT2697858.1 hypothetical protein [Kluyvera intermedia]